MKSLGILNDFRIFFHWKRVPVTCSLYTEIVFARPNQTTCTVYIHAGAFIVQDLISISKEYNVYIYFMSNTIIFYIPGSWSWEYYIIYFHWSLCKNLDELQVSAETVLTVRQKGINSHGLWKPKIMPWNLSLLHFLPVWWQKFTVHQTWLSEYFL
jgi:hypothetical protein